MKNDKAAILMIYTGGTIGMKQDPEDGVLKPFDFGAILEEVPELSKFALRIDSVTFDPLIDSSDVDPSMWVKLCRIILESYDRYDGFVVLHGTDTMAYSASALSFMLSNLGKSVIFTGSQLPVGAPRTDGRENLVSAVEIAAAKGPDGHSMVPEVAIFFDSRLIRGNRATKVSSDAFSAFRSPNYPLLAEAGISIRYNRQAIRYPRDWDAVPGVQDRLDTRVAVLKIHPGITPSLLRYFLCGPDIRAVILETYGSGNAPAGDWFLDIISEASREGKILLNVTQCAEGFVDMDIYATGKALEKRGVISGYDSTTESALAKLFCLMGRYSDNADVKKALSQNLRGEITV